MLVRSLIFAVVCSICFATGPAYASGELEVQFDLSSSQASVGGFPFTAGAAGSVSVVVEADGPVTPLPGVATVSDLTLSIDIFAEPIVGALAFAGSVSLQQPGPVEGTLSADGTQVTLDPGTFAVDAVGTIECQGVFCSIFGLDVIVIDTTIVNSAVQGIGVGGLDQPSGAMLLTSVVIPVQVNLPGFDALNIAVMGTEVARDFDPGDTDGDGVPDEMDRCVVSVLDPTVVIDRCDSGVPNALSADGCTITDEVLMCAGGPNHGSFVSCVAQLRQMLDLESAQNGAIQSCAAQSSF